MPDTQTIHQDGQLDPSTTDFDLSDLADATAKALGSQWHAERLTEELGAALGLNEELPAIRHDDGFAVTFEALPPRLRHQRRAGRPGRERPRRPLCAQHVPGARSRHHPR